MFLGVEYLRHLSATCGYVFGKNTCSIFSYRYVVFLVPLMAVAEVLFGVSCVAAADKQMRCADALKRPKVGLHPWLQTGISIYSDSIHYPSMRDTGGNITVGLDYSLNERVSTTISLNMGRGRVHYKSIPEIDIAGIKQNDTALNVSSIVKVDFTNGLYGIGAVHYYRRTDEHWRVSPPVHSSFDSYVLKGRLFKASLKGGTHIPLGTFDVNPLLRMIYLDGSLHGTSVDDDDALRKTIYQQKFATTSVEGSLQISTRLGRNGNVIPTLGVVIGKVVALGDHIRADNSTIEKFAVPINYHVNPGVNAALNVVASDSTAVGFYYDLRFDDGRPRSILAVSVRWSF